MSAPGTPNGSDAAATSGKPVVRASQAAITAVQEALGCDDCGHVHTPEGCTGPPTPSDLWAGVSPAGCDCDFDQIEAGS